MFAGIQARLEIFSGLASLIRLKRVKGRIRFFKHEFYNLHSAFRVCVPVIEEEHVFLVVVQAEILAELLQQVRMELALELVVLCEVELFDNLVVQFPGIEDGPYNIRILVIHGNPEKGTHSSPANQATERPRHGLRRCRRSNNRSRCVPRLNNPHDQDKSDYGRDSHKPRKKLEMLQVAIDDSKAKFDKTCRFLFFHKLLVIDVNDERRRDHT